MTLVLGIDPGLTGAIACIHGETLLWVEDMPVIGKEIAIPLLHGIATSELEPEAVGIEFVHSMPKQGVASTFKFGKAYGIALGVFSAHYRTIDVRPQEWKKTFHLSGKDKDAARLLAIKLWPAQAELFKRKKDGGRADAALIALHTARTVTALGDNRSNPPTLKGVA